MIRNHAYTLSFLSLVWAACSAWADIPAWAHWRQVGPNELVTCGGSSREPAVSVTNRAWHEAVWVGAGFDIAAEARTADVVELEVRSDHPHTQLIKIDDGHGHAGVWNLHIGTQWQTLRLRLAQPHERQGGAPDRAAWIEFSFFVRPPADNVVADVQVRRVACVQETSDRVADTRWMPARHAPPAPGHRVELTVHNVGNGTDYPGLGSEHGYNMLMEISQYLYGLYSKSLGISVAYAEGPWARKWADWMRSKGCHVGSEGHVSGGLDNLARLGALQLNNEGRSYRDFVPHIDATHGEDQTSDAWIAWAAINMVNKAAAAGARDWRSIDYIWPCHGGYSWTEGAASRAFWPKALMGRDGGLELDDGRKLLFADYFRRQTGLALTPAFAGLASWKDYRPPKGAEARGDRAVLQDLLVHYAWLRSQNEMGREAFKQSGLRMKPVLNPENLETGADITGLARGRFCGGACVEWWADVDCVVNTYATGAYFARALKKYGRELILTEETAAAGGDPYHGRPAYWDNPTTYALCYAKAATTGATAVYNQYWQDSLARALDTSRPDYEVYASFISCFDGFLQAFADGARKVDTDVLVIAQRAITARVPSLDRSAGGQATAARHLMKLNYNHQVGAFPLDDSFELKEFRTVFFNPVRAPAGTAKKLVAWLTEREGRTLVAYPKNLSAFFGDGQEKVPGLERPIVGEVKTDDGRVVADVRRAGEGRLVVFRDDLGVRREEADDRAAVAAVMKFLKYEPLGLSEKDRYATLGFDDRHGRTFLVLDPSAPAWAKDDKDRVWRRFQHRASQAKGVVKCRLPKAGAWRMTDRLNGTEGTVRADADGWAAVSMDGFNLRLVSFVPAE